MGLIESLFGSTYIIYTILFCVLTPYIVSLNKEERRKQKLLGGIPGPSTLPVLGNALDLAKSAEEFIPTLTKWYREYGPRYVFKIGQSWRLLLANPKDLETLLKSQVEIIKSVEYDRFKIWLGTGLVNSTGEKWTKRRKMLTPAFHFKILDQFLETINSQTSTLMEILKRESGKGQVFDAVPYISNYCTLDIICETAMGTNVNSQTHGHIPYIKFVLRLSELQMFRTLRPWFFPNVVWRLSPYGREEQRLVEIAHAFTDEIIRERKLLLAGKNQAVGKQKLAFLDLLIEAQKDSSNELTDEGIREETDTFMFAGQDTTATSAHFTLFLLASYPEAQEKVQAELDAIFQNDSERIINAADLSQMKYLECCIKESLRLYPSAPLLGRTMQSDFQLDADTIVPKGTVIFPSIYLLHRDEKVFPDPEKFVPERFLPENCVGRNPFAYLPFSAGPRNCIGQKFAMMEGKVLMASIFRYFKVEAVERQEDLRLASDMILRCLNGVKVKMTPRHTAN